MVVEALLVAVYLDNELILIDIRNPFRSSTCLVRYSWFLSSRTFPVGSYPAGSHTSWSIPAVSPRIATETRPIRNIALYQSWNSGNSPTAVLGLCHRRNLTAHGRKYFLANHGITTFTRSRSQNAGNPKLLSLVNSAFRLKDEIRGIYIKLQSPSPKPIHAPVRSKPLMVRMRVAERNAA